MSEPYKGIIPIAPTIFHENGDLDHEGNRRVMDLMVDQGVDGICILANFSEQFLLTDAERDEVMRLSIEQVAGRVPVCVTTSHFSTRIAAQRAKVERADHRLYRTDPGRRNRQAFDPDAEQRHRFERAAAHFAADAKRDLRSRHHFHDPRQIAHHRRR